MIEFVEWALELMPPGMPGNSIRSVDCLDTRRRFTPQIPSNDGQFVWIETHRFDSQNPEFYTTKEVYKKWKAIKPGVPRTKKYLEWVKQAELPPLTNNQSAFAEWLLENSEDIDKIGDMEKIFKSVRKFLKQ